MAEILPQWADCYNPTCPAGYFFCCRLFKVLRRCIRISLITSARVPCPIPEHIYIPDKERLARVAHRTGPLPDRHAERARSALFHGGRVKPAVTKLGPLPIEGP